MEVYPGSVLGSSEKYMSGDYTYSENDKVYSAVVGNSEKSGEEVKVIPVKRVLNFSPGTLVYGRVENIVGNIAIVSIVPAEEEEDVRYANPDIWAVLHISNLGYGYVKDMREVLLIGDIIRAEITNYNPRKSVVDITMDGKGLGIIIPRFGRKVKPKPTEKEMIISKIKRRYERSRMKQEKKRFEPDHERENYKYKKSYETKRKKKVFGRKKGKRKDVKGHSRTSRKKVVENIKRMLKK